jgi:hypothetical protein
MVKGEAMTRWGYSPIENIAFALQNIAKILERIENKMPVPEGNITTSEILIPVVEEVVEDSTTEEEVIPFERINTDDLPELS